MSDVLVTSADRQYGPLSIPAGTKIPSSKEELSDAKKLLKTLKSDGDTVRFTVSQLISLLALDEISYYPHNRGNGQRVSPNKDRILENGIQWGLIGEVVVGYYENKLTQACWHSRGVAVLTAYLAGSLTKKDLAMPITVKFTKDHRKAYAEFGRGGGIHRPVEKLLCPDLCYGEHFSLIRSKVGDQIFNSLGESGKLNQISNLLYNISLGTDAKTAWPSFYAGRAAAEKRRDMVAGTLSISDKDMDIVAQIISEYYNIKLLTSDKGMTAVHKVGFFGVFLCDRFYNTGVFPKSTAQVVANIRTNYPELIRLVPELCRSNQTNVIVAVERLRKILHKRVKSKAA